MHTRAILQTVCSVAIQSEPRVLTNYFVSTSLDISQVEFNQPMQRYSSEKKKDFCKSHQKCANKAGILNECTKKRKKTVQNDASHE